MVLIHLPWIDFNGLTTKDTLEYVDVAERWLMSPYIHIRPLAYPSLIFLSKLLSNSYPFGLLIHLQILAYAISGVLFFELLEKEKPFPGKYPALVHFSVTLIAFLSPQVLAFNSVILPENMPLVFILLIVHLYLQPYSLLNSILLSVFIVLSILFKPVWLILFILPIVKMVYSKEHIRIKTRGLLTQFALIGLLYGIHQFVTTKQNPNSVSATTLDVNLNLSLIRMGMIAGAESSTLYHFLNQNKAIPEIQQRKWTNQKDEFNNFTALKNMIPWTYREDPMFWKSILKKHPHQFVQFTLFQCRRFPSFFTTSPTSNKVDLTFDVMNKIHQGFYGLLHKFYIGIPLLLLFLLTTLVNQPKTLGINQLILWITLPTALLITVLTYQDAHFLRMRSALEPFIIYMTIYALYWVIQKSVTKWHYFARKNTINLS